MTGEGEGKEGFFRFRSNFCAITRLETLATQAIIVMAESCAEALSKEILLHTQSTGDMYYKLDTLVKPC